MACEYHRIRRIEFADTDAAGIVHFANFFRFMEETEHEFLRQQGLSVHTAADGFSYSFPRISCRCDFLRPARFEDEIEIHLRVVRKGNSALTYQFLVSHHGDHVAHGEIVTACCRCYPDGRIETSRIPDFIAAKIEEAPYPPLAFGRRARHGSKDPVKPE